MGNFILIAIGIIFVLLILRFIFRSLKFIFYIAILLVLGAVGLHYFSPETIDKYIGKDKHDQITGIVTEKADSLMEQSKKVADNLIEDATENIKDEVDEVIN